MTHCGRDQALPLYIPVLAPDVLQPTVTIIVSYATSNRSKELRRAVMATEKNRPQQTPHPGESTTRHQKQHTVVARRLQYTPLQPFGPGENPRAKCEVHCFVLDIRHGGDQPATRLFAVGGGGYHRSHPRKQNEPSVRVRHWNATRGVPYCGY